MNVNNYCSNFSSIISKNFEIKGVTKPSLIPNHHGQRNAIYSQLSPTSQHFWKEY